MSVFRVNKNKDYVVMSKYHFKEKDMSLKAKGLLSEMLSLPDDWDYSVLGLEQINKETSGTINSILKELEEFGYLERIQLRGETGAFKGYEYNIYEKPYMEKPYTKNPYTDNQQQLNNKELNNNKLNNNNKEKNIKKRKYGEYQNVLLTDKEYEKLHDDYLNADDLIKFLDEYIEEKGYKSKSHNLAIRRWVVDAVKEKNIKRKDAKKFDRPSWLDMDL